MGFKQREKKSEGVKFLFFGEEATGKTPAALSYPNQALVDSDSGTTFYDGENVLVESSTLSFKELNQDLDQLELDKDLFNKVETFNIDSVTRFHENLQHASLKVVEKRAEKNNRASESEGLSQKEYGIMKLHYERFFARMLGYAKQGKNLVFVAEQKDDIDKKTDQYGKEIQVKVGVLPSMQKGSKHDFDVVVNTYKKNNDSFGKVVKDRTGTFKVGDEIERPNYSHWKEAVEKARNGKQRDKSEIKNFDDVVNSQAEDLDESGDMIKDEIMNHVKELSRDNKQKFIEKMKEDLGTEKFKNFTDKKKLNQALEIVKSIK